MHHRTKDSFLSLSCIFSLYRSFRIGQWVYQTPVPNPCALSVRWCAPTRPCPTPWASWRCSTASTPTSSWRTTAPRESTALRSNCGVSWRSTSLSRRSTHVSGLGVARASAAARIRRLTVRPTCSKWEGFWGCTEWLQHNETVILILLKAPAG